MPPKAPKDLSQPVELDNGERVLLGTRRPDGTLRKERRIRPGYTPQEEQPLYQSKGVLSRQNVPVCPGMDPGMLAEAAAAAAKSKAQKKNEKRKEKKASEDAPGSTSAPASIATSTATPKPSAPAPAAKPAAAAPAAPAPAPPAPAEELDPKAAAEKALRALKKKVRQAEQLEQKRAAGTALSPEEAEKAGKLPGWVEEISSLEAQLAKLST